LSGASRCSASVSIFAGDELSGEEQGENPLARHRPPINYQEIPIAAARQQSEDAALMFEWFDRVGYDAGYRRIA